MTQGLSVVFVSPDDLINYRKIMKALNRGMWKSWPTIHDHKDSRHSHIILSPLKDFVTVVAGCRGRKSFPRNKSVPAFDI